MNKGDILGTLEGVPVHLVGIKGTGMVALAEILQARGAAVSGSDTDEVFYTDAILQELGIPYFESFSEEHVTGHLRLVVHSDSYSRGTNPELVAAAALRIPLLSYAEAVGELSRTVDFSGICGVHGKTTTTALAGSLLKSTDLPVTVLAASRVPAFGHRSTLVRGDRFLVAEMDEYRRHFLHSFPDRVVMTAIEPDHLDYFADLDDIMDAFITYGTSLSKEGTLVYCADDPGVNLAISRIAQTRADLKLVPYGETAEGPYRIARIVPDKGQTRFQLTGFPEEFSIKLPGRHLVGNATAALALAFEIVGSERLSRAEHVGLFRKALAEFESPKRRSEVVGSAGGIMILDDYAHHPTAVAKTLQGLRDFYDCRRLLVDFMSHTYSRTKALLGDFATCFQHADLVVLHRIYASARESDTGAISGRDLFEAVAQQHDTCVYFEEPMDALEYLLSTLRPGDLFVTMGAGDNWKLGLALNDALRRRDSSRGVV